MTSGAVQDLQNRYQGVFFDACGLAAKPQVQGIFAFSSEETLHARSTSSITYTDQYPLSLFSSVLYPSTNTDDNIYSKESVTSYLDNTISRDLSPSSSTMKIGATKSSVKFLDTRIHLGRCSIFL